MRFSFSQWLRSLRQGSPVRTVVQPERPAVEGLESRLAPAALALFNNSAYVGSTNAANMQSALTAAGHTVTTFTGTTASAWATALSGKALLAVPPQTVGTGLGTLVAGDASLKTTIQNYVSSGGGLIVAGYDAFDYDITFLNTTFNFSLSADGDPPGAVFNLNTTNAAGTPFAGGPGTLTEFDLGTGTGEIASTSLPGGAKSIYDNGPSGVALLSYGGHNNGIVYLGYEWSGTDANWSAVLARAVSTVSGTLSATLDGAGNLRIIDTIASGRNNTLTVGVSGGNLIITDAAESFFVAPAGGTLSNGNKTLTIPLASVTGTLTIDTDYGTADTDPITVNALPGFLGGLTLGTAAYPLDTITFAGVVTLGANKDLTAFASGTINLPNGVSDVATTGTGSISLTTARDITLASSASLITVDGNLTLSANQQSPATTGAAFVGIDVNAGSIRVNGTGVLDVRGRGGDSSNSQYGVYVHGGSDIRGGTAVSATVTVRGTGGAAPQLGNYGVVVTGTNSRITSLGGSVSVLGFGGAGSSLNTGGIQINAGGVISAGGTGSVTVQGTAGASSGSSGFTGVQIGDAGSMVTSTNGNVNVTGIGAGSGTSVDNFGVQIYSGGKITAGGSGTVIVSGTGGGGSGGFHYGVYVTSGGSAITSSGGAVDVTGYGGGEGAENYGVYVRNGGQIAAVGPGTVTVQGTGGSSPANYNVGVNLSGSGASVTSGGGNVEVIGIGTGSGASAYNMGVRLSAAAQITAGPSGTVTVTGNGGLTTGTSNYGILVQDAGTAIGSNAGNVIVTGQGGGSGTSDNSMGVLVYVGAQITAGGAGTVTVSGTGGAGSGATNYGVHVVFGSAAITSSGGAVSVTGIGGNTISEGVFLRSTGTISSGGTGNLTITTDSLLIDPDNTSIIRAGTAGNGLATIQTRTANTRIDVGGADVLNASPLTLGLTDDELDRVTAGTLIIGDASSGTITVSAAITHGNNLALTTGVGITVNQPVTLAADKSLTVSAVGTIDLQSGASDVVTTGTGSISMTTLRDIVLNGGSVTTVNGNLNLSANRQGTPTSGSFFGIFVISGGSIRTTGTGVLDVRGKGGDSGISQYGVYLDGGEIVGGTSGSTTVIGTGGASSGSFNYGVEVVGMGSRIASTGGSLLVTGQGGGSGASTDNIGVRLAGAETMTSGGSGTVAIVGIGGTGSSRGISVAACTITSGGGNVQLTGQGSNNYAIQVFSSGTITTAANGGSITLVGDSMSFDATASITADTNLVTLRQQTNGTQINLGSSDVLISGSQRLGLTDAELDRVTASTLQIGDATSGTITVSFAVTRSASTAVNVTSGNNIAFPGPGSLDSAGGNVTLSAIFGAITSGTAATDVVAGAGSVTLNAGPSGIGASGNPFVVSGSSLATTAVNSANQYLAATGSIAVGTVGLNAFGSAVVLEGGTFTLGGSNRISDGTRLIVNGATFDVGAFDETVHTLTLASGSLIGTSGVLTSTNTIQAQSGTAGAKLGGPNGLTKTTGGTVTLTASNTYSGTTTIASGTLALAGAFTNNLANSATLDVQSGTTLNVTSLTTNTLTLTSGQTLKGTGTVVGTTTATTGSTLAPGTSPGILHTGDVTFNSGSTFSVEINGTTAGTQYDQLDVTGTVTLGGTLAVSGTYGPSGTDAFVLIANDGSDAISGAFAGLPEGATVTVNGQACIITYVGGDGNDVVLFANAPPVADDDSATTDEDTSVLIDVLANDSDTDNDTLSILGVTQPTHGTAAIEAGQVRYTPEADYHGADSFTYTVSDGRGGTDTAAVTLTVSPVNDAPSADDATYSTPEDTPLDAIVTGSDVENDPLTFVLVTDATYGSVVLNSDGTFTYTPEADYHGPDSFTFATYDGELTSTPATVTLNVTAVNDAPVADDTAFSTDEDTPLNESVTASDVDGDVLTYAVVVAPQFGTLVLNPNGTFTYTPDLDYNGDDSFTFVANDGTIDSNVATVTLTINPVNDTPVADDASFTTDEDTELADQLTGSDVDGDTLAFAVFVAPANGTLVLNPDGSFTYTPDADFFGSDSFLFVVNDGTEDSAPATVTLTVTAVNDPPVADPADFFGDEDTPINEQLTATDVEGDPLTFALATAPTFGTVTVNPDGTFTYIPDLNYNGDDSFTFVANDGIADSVEATVTITVTPVNDAPVADDVTVTLNDDGTGAIDLTGSDVETPAEDLVFTVTSLPVRGQLLRPDLTPIVVGDTFPGSPASLLYRLTFAFGEVSDTFTYTVRDTGDPAGTPGNVLTSPTATVTVLTPAGSAGVVWAAGGESDDTVVVTHTPTGGNLQVTINSTVVSNTIPLASVTEVRAYGWGGNDTLQLLDLVVSATADGGADSDTLRIDGTSAANTFTVADGSIDLDTATITVAGLESYTLNGQGGTDTLFGPDSGGAWVVTGVNNAGTLNSHIAFGTIESLRGGTDDDTFAFAAGRSVTGLVDGGDGNDTLSYSGYTTAVSVNLQTNTATGTGGIANIEALVGGTATTDLLTGPNVDSAWVLSGVDAGDVNGFTFADVERLTGGSAIDTLTVQSGGGLSGTFTGGTGSDQILGPDAPTTWNITNTNTGSLTGVFAFTAVENLTGGSADDSFVFSAGRSVTGDVAGGGGNDTLDYTAYTTAITVNLQNATATGTGGIASVEKVIGGSSATVTDTVVAANDPNAWTITGRNAGTVDGFEFSGVENLTGGTDVDTFTVEVLDSWTGTLNGGTFTGVIDTLIGPDVGNNWIVSSTNGGTLNSRTFTGIENLTGGSAADTFAFNAGRTVTGVVTGGDGTDTLSYAAYTTAVTINLQTGAATGTGGIADIESFVGGTTANDVLIGADTTNMWTLTGANAGTLNGAGTFVGIERPTGGAGADTFEVHAGASVTGAIQGSGGTDTLSYASYGSIVTVNVQTPAATATGGFAGVEILIGSAVADTVIGPNVASTWTVTGANAITVAGLAFQEIENATGGTATDTFDLRAGFALTGAITGGNGTDTLLGADDFTAWSITALNTGTVSGMGFAVENLTSGALDDTFTFASNARMTGLVDGGGGSNRLVYTSGVTINLQNGTATSGGGTMPFVNVMAVTGNSAADTLTGGNAANTWNLTGTNQGNVNGFLFDGIENLTGGTGDDDFLLATAASLTGQASGGNGLDTLSYAAWSAGVTVNLGTNAATGLGSIASMEHVLGGSGNDILTGTGANNLLVGNAGNDSLTGGNGRDFLIGGLGMDTLNGGGADDLLIAGTTDYDTNLLALKAILAEWSRTDENYLQRVANLSNSTANGVPPNGSYTAAYYLTAVTVHDDGSVDTLTGGASQDWFFALLGEVTDRNAAQEILTLIS